MIEALGIVVPARDEEALLGASLATIRRAAAHPALARLPVHIVAVLDDCADRSGEVAVDALAGLAGGRLVESRFGSAGAARAAGVRAVLAAEAGREPERVWIATTDADTRVPPNWLVRQLGFAGAGADAVAGTVEVDGWHEQPRHVRRLFQEHYASLGRSDGHRHVHGANLGLRASALVAAGGMPPIPLAEDHALVDALSAAGARIVRSGTLRVVTSARREGRAAGGFSDLLRRLGETPAS